MNICYAKKKLCKISRSTVYHWFIQNQCTADMAQPRGKVGGGESGDKTVAYQWEKISRGKRKKLVGDGEIGG